MSGRLAFPLSLDRIARAVRDVLNRRRSSPDTSASAPVVAEPLEPGRLLSGQADLQFLDTFAVSGNRYDSNFEHDAPGRQSGPLAPLTWGEYGTANYRTGLDWQHQVGSPDLPGGLLMRAKVGTSYWVGMAAPNDGFAPDPGPGGAVAVEFDVDPVLAAPGYNPSQSAWAGVKLGSAEPGRKVNEADGFGLLLRGSGGFQAFDGSASVATGRYAAATPAEDRSYHLRIEVASADPSGRPFDGGPAVVRAFVDGAAEPFVTHLRQAGFTSNFVTVQGDGEGSGTDGAAGHGFDNLAVYARPATATPTRLAAPTGLTATALTPDAIALSWADNAAGEAGYEVERSPDGVSDWQPVATPGADATGHTDVHLPSDTHQFYRVRAVGVFADIHSTWSDIASASTGSASTGGGTFRGQQRERRRRNRRNGWHRRYGWRRRH